MELEELRLYQSLFCERLIVGCSSFQFLLNRAGLNHDPQIKRIAQVLRIVKNYLHKKTWKMLIVSKHFPGCKDEDCFITT